MFLLASFILGITSSLHCIGMCGPIMLGAPIKKSSPVAKLFSIVQYHSGRILSYSVLGLIVGVIGMSLSLMNFLQWLSIIAGILFLLFAWKSWFYLKFEKLLSFQFTNRFVSFSFGKLRKSETPFKSFFYGIINGLLPCGMVYIALLGAITSGDMLLSSLAMISFGLGTLPALLIFTFYGKKMAEAIPINFTTLKPIVLSLVATLMILRGLNLNIPYISPKIQQVSSQKSIKTLEKTTKVVMDCCSKNKSCD